MALNRLKLVREITFMKDLASVRKSRSGLQIR